MRDLIAQVEEMLKPANIPVHLQYELALEGSRGVESQSTTREIFPGCSAPMNYPGSEFKPAVGLAPEDSGALCAECPHQEGCSHVCQIEWEESGGEG